MKIDFTPKALDGIDELSPIVKKVLYKQLGFLKTNLRHPSLRAKKYEGFEDVWQARVNDDWRFYFLINGGAYLILEVIPHPK